MSEFFEVVGIFASLALLVALIFGGAAFVHDQFHEKGVVDELEERIDSLELQLGIPLDVPPPEIEVTPEKQWYCPDCRKPSIRFPQELAA